MTQEEKSIQLCEKLLPLLKEGKEVEIHPSGTSMFPLINPPSDSVVLRHRGYPHKNRRHSPISKRERAFGAAPPLPHKTRWLLFYRRQPDRGRRPLTGVAASSHRNLHLPKRTYLPCNASRIQNLQQDLAFPAPCTPIYQPPPRNAMAQAPSQPRQMKKHLFNALSGRCPAGLHNKLLMIHHLVRAAQGIAKVKISLFIIDFITTGNLYRKLIRICFVVLFHKLL